MKNKIKTLFRSFCSSTTLRTITLIVFAILSLDMSVLNGSNDDNYVDDTYFQPEVSFEQKLKDADNLTPKYDRNMKEFIFLSPDSIPQDTTQLKTNAL